MFEFVVREDIYYIYIPVTIAIIGWILPLIKNTYKSYNSKWRILGEKSEQEIYTWNLLKILLLGGIVFFIIAIILELIDEAILECFTVNIPISFKNVLKSMMIIGVIVMLTEKFGVIELKFVKVLKHEKIISCFMKYTPYMISIWLFGFSWYIKSVSMDNLMIVL